MIRNGKYHKCLSSYAIEGISEIEKLNDYQYDDLIISFIQSECEWFDFFEPYICDSDAQDNPLNKLALLFFEDRTINLDFQARKLMKMAASYWECSFQHDLDEAFSETKTERDEIYWHNKISNIN